MLSNNGLCLRAAAQYVLLFLVLMVNSDRFHKIPKGEYNQKSLLMCLLKALLEYRICLPVLSILLSPIGYTSSFHTPPTYPHLHQDPK